MPHQVWNLLTSGFFDLLMTCNIHPRSYWMFHYICWDVECNTKKRSSNLSGGCWTFIMVVITDLGGRSHAATILEIKGNTIRMMLCTKCGLWDKYRYFPQSTNGAVVSISHCNFCPYNVPCGCCYKNKCSSEGIIRNAHLYVQIDHHIFSLFCIASLS